MNNSQNIKMQKLSLSNSLNHKKYPTVTVVIPVLNEIDIIGQCIEAVLKQDYPSDRVELIVVDGLSRDGTREKILKFSKKNNKIHLLNNEKKITSAGLNIGIKYSRSDIVIIIGAHSIMKEDFISLCVQYMNKLGVKCVGGKQVILGNSFIQQAIGFAMSSPFGITSAPHRYQNKEKFVDTVAHAAYDHSIFDIIGYFDENSKISEDAEFNWRLRKAGYKIYFTPKIISYYFPRNSLTRLIKQFFRYGILRVNVIKKHLDAIKFLHLIPSVSIILFIILLLLGIIEKRFLYIILFLGGLYLIVNMISSLSICFKNDVRYILILPIIFISIHMSWGIGFIVGLFKSQNK